MGNVYRAWDMSLHREVAVKLMKPEMAADPIQVEAFMREARAPAGLNHTNIVHIYTCDEADGQKYLAMELADRGSLDTLIEANGRVDELKVLDVGIQVSSALEAALKHKLLHLDIKPLNILFNADGEAKLIDFGLAQSTDAENDYSGSIFGTAYYIAPERMVDQRTDFRSDMYSLAATLYHALTGHVPFEAASTDEVALAHTNTPLTPPIDVVPDIMPQTNEALVQAMSKNPDDRFQSYFEFRMSLEAARTALHFRRNPPDEQD
jgi:serine/threonine protein kinase